MSTHNNATPHSDDDYIHAAHLMRGGGAFAAHLADAYFVADRHNAAILRHAFAALFTRYYNLYLRMEEHARQ